MVKNMKKIFLFIVAFTLYTSVNMNAQKGNAQPSADSTSKTAKMMARADSSARELKNEIVHDLKDVMQKLKESSKVVAKNSKIASQEIRQIFQNKNQTNPKTK